jgi:hypothetical protein
LEELLKQILTSMDQNFHEVLGSLENVGLRLDRHDILLEAISQRLHKQEQAMVQTRNAVALGTKSLAELMAGITGHALTLDDKVEALQRRVAAIEKRLPPEAA